MRKILFIAGMMAVAIAAKAQSYSNPIIPTSLPDPTVIRADDGTFYLYATENIRNTPIYSSPNLVDWQYVGTAFTDSTRPQWNAKGNLWAPDINRIGSRYVMYYSKSTWGGEWTCGIGVATADSPEGPFTDHGALFTSKEINVQNSIDPFFITDNGHNYLFWGSFHGIYGIELSDDGLALKSGSSPVRVAGNFMEGTYIHRHGNYYYLFGSEGTCCEGARSTYHVTVGRSTSLFGPYTDRQGQPLLEGFHETILHGDDAVKGPGHNAEIITDDRGHDYLIYHGFNAADPDAGRLVYMDRIVWKKGWPSIKNGVPSSKAKAPKFRK